MSRESLPALHPPTKARRPLILLVVDRPNWAFDRQVMGLRTLLGDEFEFRALYCEERARVLTTSYDLMHVFFWGETSYRGWAQRRERLIKSVRSHRWQHDGRWGVRTTAEFVSTYLADAVAVETPSPKLQALLAGERDGVHLLPPPIILAEARAHITPTGPLKIGWAGNPTDPEKEFDRFFPAALPDRVEFAPATGQYSQAEMPRYYEAIDVLCITSRSEGTPQPLLDALASGCFVVATDVGLVSTLVGTEDGAIIDRQPEALRAQLEWCRANLDQIRTRRNGIATRFRSRYDPGCVRERWSWFYREAISHAERDGVPRIRPGVATDEVQRVGKLLSQPAPNSGATGTLPLSRVLRQEQPAGSRCLGTAWVSHTQTLDLIWRCADGRVVIDAANQRRVDRMLRVFKQRVAALSAVAGLTRVARWITRLPTRYTLSLRKMHSNC